MVRTKEVKKIKGVYERKPGSNIWWIHWQHAGKRHREMVGTRSAAINLYMKRKSEAQAGRKLETVRITKDVTLGELIDAAVEHSIMNLKRKHPRDYTSKAAIVKAAFGSRAAAEITPQDIEKWQISRHVSPATCNRYRDFISICYRLGMKNGKVTSNPARLVDRRQEPSGRLRYLSRAEFGRLAEAVREDNPEQLAALEVSTFTGIRWSEQFGITWAQVDWTGKCIRLTKTKNKSDREVPLNSVALDAIKRQWAAQSDAKPTDKVFPLPGHAADHRWWFNPALKKAKITGVSWHTLRHTFCSWLAMAGVNLKEIQVLAGHKRVEMSARYAHLSPGFASAASEKMVKTKRART